MRAKDDIALERVKKFLAYDAASGILTWIAKPNRCIVRGSVAGRQNVDGYIRIGIDGRQYAAHRIGWLITYGEWPAGVLDHINGNRCDNRLCNLRVVSHQENCQNQRAATSLSRSGVLGASWAPHARKWHSAIKLNDKSRHLGYFDTPEEAHAAYVQAKRRIHPGCTL